MERMREIIRGNLARSLRRCGEEDRLAAALPVVCGGTLASHCEVERLDEAGTLHLRVDGEDWLSPLLGMREVMRHELQRVAGVALTGLHFVQPGAARGGAPGPPAEARRQGAPGEQNRNRYARTDRPRRPA